jgi:hypothetical protein
LERQAAMLRLTCHEVKINKLDLARRRPQICANVPAVV